MLVFHVGLLPRSLFYPTLPQGPNTYTCMNMKTHTHTEPKRIAQCIVSFIKKKKKNTLKLGLGIRNLKTYLLKKMKKKMFLFKKRETGILTLSTA